MELIDRESLKAELLKNVEALADKTGFFEGIKMGYESAVYFVEQAPTVEKRKHGYWIEKPLAGNTTVTCSCCKTLFIKNSTKFACCPYCEAIMDGESND